MAHRQARLVNLLPIFDVMTKLLCGFFPFYQTFMGRAGSDKKADFSGLRFFLASSLWLSVGQAAAKNAPFRVLSTAKLPG